MPEQFPKSSARYSNGVERCGSADLRIARLVRNQRGLAENIAECSFASGALALDLRLALEIK